MICKKALIKLIKRPLVAISGHNSNTHSSNITALNKFVVAFSMFAEALIVTEAIYDVRESDNCPRTFETYFIYTVETGYKVAICPREKLL